jgi:hypothetical protein
MTHPPYQYVCGLDLPGDLLVPGHPGRLSHCGLFLCPRDTLFGTRQGILCDRLPRQPQSVWTLVVPGGLVVLTGLSLALLVLSAAFSEIKLV